MKANNIFYYYVTIRSKNNYNQLHFIQNRKNLCQYIERSFMLATQAGGEGSWNYTILQVFLYFLSDFFTAISIGPHL